MNNKTYFPKTLRIRKEIIDLGPEDVKDLYNCKNLKELTNKTFSEEYSQYLKNEEYFPGCPYKIYVDTYEERFSSFKSIYPDAYEIQFLEQENEIISRVLEMHDKNNHNFYKFYLALDAEPHKKNLELSAKKVRDCFIDKRVYELGHFFIVPGVDPVDQHLFPRSYFKIYIDPTASETLEVKPNRTALPAPSNAKSLDKPTEEITSFGFDINTAKILFQELSRADMLDASTNEEDFIKAMTCNWKNVQKKIKFNSQTAELAVFISLFRDKVEVKNNLNGQNIEASKLFLSRTRKPTLIKDVTLRNSRKRADDAGSLQSKTDKMSEIVNRISLRLQVLSEK